MARPILVLGIGTEVGKTLASAILVEAYGADYWKPVQTGDRDAETIKRLVSSKTVFHPESYYFSTAVSPHYAAHLENKEIDIDHIKMPSTDNTLVIESCGGILSPLTKSASVLSLFKKWQGQVFLVSRHYLGSLNHTLLSIEVLKQHSITIDGLILNGPVNPELEAPLFQAYPFKHTLRLFPEDKITPSLIKLYGKEWQRLLQN